MDVAQFADRLEQSAQAIEPKALVPALRERVLPRLQAGIGENYEHRATAQGAKWPPRKDPRPKHPLLELSGKLRAASQGGAGSIAEDDETGVTIGVDSQAVPYARTHQHGDPRRNIAQRKYYDESEAVLDDVEDILADVMGKVL